ncbi:uncharacterized protein LOC113794159 [Dermatophagoides pteronyssinus]|uniref:uncharacterized protein LOC113794159 n=1 Tax=Dermatophagoides pteronyssinus TaxID=6956 RepID=UPI003F679490
MSFLFCCFRKPKQLPYKPKVEKKFRPVTIFILPKKNRKRTKKLKQMMFYNDYVIRRITDNNNNDNQPQSQSLSLESNIDDEDADDEKIEENLSSISINQQQEEEEETIADVNDDDITEDIEQSIQSIQSTLLLTSLPTIYEHPMEDDYYDDDIENNNNSPFQMEPIRLHFTDESSSSQTSSSYNSNNDGCCIDNNNISKQQINKSSSICNLDHLFGSETISFTMNNSDKKTTVINRPRRLVIRRNDDGSLIDEIVDADVDDKSFVDRDSIADSGKPTGSGHESSPFQMKLERGRGSRHHYQIDRQIEFGSNEWKTTLEQIFRTPKKAEPKPELDDWNLNKLFQEPVRKLKQNQTIQSLQQQQQKNSHLAKSKRRFRRQQKQIDFDIFTYDDDWSLKKLFKSSSSCANERNERSVKKQPEKEPKKEQLSDDDNISIDSTCLDSGIGSFESHVSQVDDNNIDNSNGNDNHEKFSITKEFWKQFCNDRMKKFDYLNMGSPSKQFATNSSTKSPKIESFKSQRKISTSSSPPSPTIKAFKSLPEPLIHHENNNKQQTERLVKLNRIKNICHIDDRYELLMNLKRAKIGHCYEYLNEFELKMRKYFPELEQQEDLGQLLTLLMYGIPTELYWLNYWLRSNYGCTYNTNTISRHSIDFDQLKAIILNEEQAYLCQNNKDNQSKNNYSTPNRNRNGNDDDDQSDQIRSVRSCPLPESSVKVKKNINFQLQSMQISKQIPSPIHKSPPQQNQQQQLQQRRWSVSIDRHLELMKLYRQN